MYLPFGGSPPGGSPWGARQHAVGPSDARPKEVDAVLAEPL